MWAFLRSRRGVGLTALLLLLVLDAARSAVGHLGYLAPVSVWRPDPQAYADMTWPPATNVPAGATWDSEVMNQGVHVHSKVVVIDPFGKKPVVITGSHNLGYKASTKNDDNMMIMEGNAPLAAAYAINIIAIYQAYRGLLR
jgi:phosphatidylserine/phosphatidylglycerophosphate/cardiolipin synthase-like enzyme